MKFEFLNKCLLIENKEKILVLGDLHLGYEESLNEQGIFIPRQQFEIILNELGKIFARTGKLEEIVILGDLKHEFGSISEQEWNETLEILDFLKRHSKNVILIKGNHDTILGPIAKRKDIALKDFYKTNGICFLHGDKLFPECLNKDVKMLIMGHRHPAVFLQDKYKKEKYKCFLQGKWKNTNISNEKYGGWGKTQIPMVSSRRR